MRAIELIR